MKVLVLWPPQVPSYFNAGHHLTVFTVAQHLRGVDSHDVVAVDAGALNYTWKGVGDLLVEQPDAVAIANEFDTVDSFERAVRYARTLAPAAKIVTFGRLSSARPGFFKQFDLDAIVGPGDPEVGVEQFLRIMQSDEGDVTEVGIWIRRRDGAWVAPTVRLPQLAGDELVFPDIGEIPYADYQRMYVDDTARFCGIPGRLELVVPIARGCPIGCDFCDIPLREGLRDRRPSVESAIQFIEAAVKVQPFEYVSMYAPTFTIDRRWTLEFCDAYAASSVRLPWKCTTTLHHLDESLIRAMARSNCIRISVGLETLDASGDASLPRVKRSIEGKFEFVSDLCVELGIELNCFVILGLPGNDLAGVEYTIDRVEARGGRVRPTIYTDFGEMRDDMSVADISSFNRQLFRDGAAVDSVESFYRLLFNPAARATNVQDRIPKSGQERN